MRPVIRSLAGNSTLSKGQTDRGIGDEVRLGGKSGLEGFTKGVAFPCVGLTSSEGRRQSLRLGMCFVVSEVRGWMVQDPKQIQGSQGCPSSVPQDRLHETPFLERAEMLIIILAIKV